MSIQIHSARFHEPPPPPSDDDIPMPPPPLDGMDPSEPKTGGLPPGGVIDHAPTDNMPIYTPPPDYGDMPVYDPHAPPPQIPTPTITPITREEVFAQTGIWIPIPGDVNGDRTLSRAEDEFRNGQPEPFEVRDSSTAPDPWNTERYT